MLGSFFKNFKPIISLHWCLFCVLGLFSGCCCPPEHPYVLENSQEFVIDSYNIRKGKFAILEMFGEKVPPLPKTYLEEYEDTIDEDDILKIAIFHPSRKDLETAINQINHSIGFRVINGYIQLPDLSALKVKGLTLNQARDLISETYNQHIDNITVFVEYAKRCHSKVELTGCVHVPEIPINGRIRLYEVLSLAGLDAHSNLFKSYIIRNKQMLAVDFYKLIVEGDMSQNIVMQPNDKIFIASLDASSITVMGEVGLASTIPIPNGFISLREALAYAGGIPYTGDKRNIYVIRGNILHPKVYKLSWNHITYLPNDSLLLIPGDTVYITEKPITKWNRFIDQLLPSSLLIDLGIKTSGVFYK